MGDKTAANAGDLPFSQIYAFILVVPIRLSKNNISVFIKRNILAIFAPDTWLYRYCLYRNHGKKIEKDWDRLPVSLSLFQFFLISLLSLKSA